MKKSLLVLLGAVFACSTGQPKVNEPVATKVKTNVSVSQESVEYPTEKPVEKVEAEVPLNDVQKLCLTEGPVSFAAGKEWFAENHSEACKDEKTLAALYNMASAAGGRDIVRIINANMLQCMASVNEGLSPAKLQLLENTAQSFVESAEIYSLKEQVILTSCLGPNIQKQFLTAGFGCGVVASLSLPETTNNAMKFYFKTASELGKVKTEADMKSVLLEAATCYTDVIKQVEARIGLNSNAVPKTDASSTDI